MKEGEPFLGGRQAWLSRDWGHQAGTQAASGAWGPTKQGQPCLADVTIIWGVCEKYKFLGPPCCEALEICFSNSLPQVAPIPPKARKTQSVEQMKAK